MLPSSKHAARLRADAGQDDRNPNRQTIWPSSVDRPGALAFSALTRERGISTSSTQNPTSRLAPSVVPLRPSTSIPDYTSGRLPKTRQRHQPPPVSSREEYDRNFTSESRTSPRHAPLPRHTDPGNQEVRDSFRSALTTSSSFLSPSSGTERSSLLTDRSSLVDTVRGQSEGPGVEDEGMSVDEAIGMYESGFTDDHHPNGANGSGHQIQLTEEPASMTSADILSTHNEGSPPARPRTAPTGVKSNPYFNRANTAPVPQSTFSRSSVAVPRDRYGFKKASQHVTLAQHDAWSVSYSEYLSRRRKKWIALLKDVGLSTENPTQFPARSAKVKRFVRKGVPPEWRGAAWFCYAGGHARWKSDPNLYKRLLDKAESGDISENDRELIERDLHRTFPDNIKFKPDLTGDPDNTNGRSVSEVPSETRILQALRRVLQAFSIHTPKIGYCQSLNFIAGLLLLFMEEEKAFWMLCIVTQTYLPGTHEVNLEGANVDLAVLVTSIQESMPGTWAKIGGELDGSSGPEGVERAPTRLPPITLCTTAWFMSCYIGTLPIETTLRVWDSFFYEGSKTLFRIALAIFKVGEQEIRAVNDPMEIFQVVQTIPRKLVDANALMDACFKRRNGFGHLSQDTVDARRKDWRAVYANERAKLSADTGAGATDSEAAESGSERGRESSALRSRLRRADSKARLRRLNPLRS
ncbi:MAG: hypothetical protein M4579_005679 [Chaenotheca gracillima]|nr:MAG: hypothetical protein M4579_005679 [Chaenotheca gracillima]